MRRCFEFTATIVWLWRAADNVSRSIAATLHLLLLLGCLSFNVTRGPSSTTIVTTLIAHSIIIIATIAVVVELNARRSRRRRRRSEWHTRWA